MANKEILDLLQNGKQPVSSKQVLERGVFQVLPSGDDQPSLEKRMGESEIKLYLGIDPTGTELHIGHAVPIRKLQQFQELGHKVVLLFGGFTAMIGDPSEKASVRKKLSLEQVNRNMQTYAEQAGKILDMSPTAANPIKLENNNDWLGSMTFGDVIELASNFTVQQMSARSMFHERMSKGDPLYLQEFLYPMAQGQDSVAMKVDLEIGGKDQIFNMMVGRDLVKKYLNKEKWVMGTKLIEDPNGNKMGKTEGNVVGVRSPSEVKYEAIMTWPDSAVSVGWELLTVVPLESVIAALKMVAEDELHPVVFKEALAQRVVTELDGLEAAIEAKNEFDRVYRQNQLPTNISETRTETGTSLSDIMVKSGLVTDKTEANKKIADGSVFVDGKVAKSSTQANGEFLLKLGKKPTIKNIRRIITEEVIL